MRVPAEIRVTRRDAGTRSHAGKNPQKPETCIPVTRNYPIPDFSTRNPSLANILITLSVIHSVLWACSTRICWYLLAGLNSYFTPKLSKKALVFTEVNYPNWWSAGKPISPVMMEWIAAAILQSQVAWVAEKCHPLQSVYTNKTI